MLLPHREENPKEELQEYLAEKGKTRKSSSGVYA
jgi:hypothetical protein